MSDGAIVGACVVAWYAFSLWALPRLAKLHDRRALTPERDGLPLIGFWLVSPVALPLLVIACADPLGELASRSAWRVLRPPLAFWLWATGTDK